MSKMRAITALEDAVWLAIEEELTEDEIRAEVESAIDNYEVD